MFRKSHNDSLFNFPIQLLHFMEHIKYVEFTTLMSPLSVYINACGSCHDQTLFEYTELQSQGLYPKAKFIISVDDAGQGEETHSFVYYPYRDKWYWFENAWEDLRGIREYFSEDELIDSVVYAFGRRNGFNRIYVADFIPDDHQFEEDLKTFVDICMDSAEEYNL